MVVVLKQCSSPELTHTKIKENDTPMQYFAGQGSVFFDIQRVHHANLSGKIRDHCKLEASCLDPH